MVQTVDYLRSEADKRHVGVAHRYQVSQLLIEGTHFPRPLRLFWLRVPLISKYLQGNRNKKICTSKVDQIFSISSWAQFVFSPKFVTYKEDDQ